LSKVSVDKHDLQLLTELQRNGKATNSALGEAIHLSTSQVSRRIQRLEETRVIAGYAALLDPEVVGLGVIAFTSVTLERQGNTQGSDEFVRLIGEMPEVLECFSVTGEADYILRVVSPDLASFSDFMMERLLRLPGVANVKSNVALKRLKQTHVLPLAHIAQSEPAERRLVFSA
jgi:Lrp/AsnC family leucine-responsive transcriptional regulator